jgi:hypothetical protein
MSRKLADKTDFFVTSNLRSGSLNSEAICCSFGLYYTLSGDFYFSSDCCISIGTT